MLDAMMARSYPKLLKADYPPSVLVTALPLISRAQPALLASGTYYVAETAAGALIGAGGWTRPRGQSGVGDIRHLATDADHVRQGVGRALMRRVFEAARIAGITALKCQSTRTAVPFYKAMGFTVLDACEIDLRPGIVFPAIRMLRLL